MLTNNCFSSSSQRYYKRNLTSILFLILLKTTFFNVEASENNPEIDIIESNSAQSLPILEKNDIEALLGYPVPSEDALEKYFDDVKTENDVDITTESSSLYMFNPKDYQHFLRKSEENEENFEQYNILSIDGGGIRGIMPALWLKQLSKNLEEEGLDKPLHKIFDYVGGTSIGGIIALGVAHKIPLNEIIEIFENPENRAKVFREYSDIETHLPLDYLKRFANIVTFNIAYKYKLISHRYHTEQFEELLQKVFTKGETLDNTKKPKVIVTACTDKGKPFIFRESQHYEIWEAARATSAAPTYFDAFSMKTESGDIVNIVDGGIWKNNPSYLITGTFSKEHNIYDSEKFRILSLGTGKKYNNKIIPKSAGIIHVGSILDATMNSNNEGDHKLMKVCYGTSYCRINPKLDRDIELDDITSQSYDYLKLKSEDEKSLLKLKNFTKELARKYRKYD